MIVELVVALALASDHTYTLDGQTLRIVDPSGVVSSVPAPCNARALLVEVGRLYIACGAEGVRIMSVGDPAAPTVTSSLQLGGEVVGLHLASGRIWAELVRHEARPLDEVTDSAAARPYQELSPRAEAAAAPEAPSTPSAAPASRPDRAGRVISQRSGGVIIDLGSDAGIVEGQHVALLARRDVDLVAGEMTTVEDLLAVGRVGAVSLGHAEVHLGVNESAPDGAVARVTDRALTGNRMLPPRPDDLWSVAFTVRPFLALGAVGVGTVADAHLSYRMKEHVRLALALEPLAVGFASDGNVIGTAGNFIASYDRELFEVGLGAGWSAINNEIGENRDANLAEGLTTRVENVSYGLTVAQLARLGAQDGLSLVARTTFVLYQDEFHFGGTVATAFVPVGDRTWLFGRGGGGGTGFGFGEVGLRVLVDGRGLSDSIFLSASLGGGGVFGDVEVASRKCVSDPGTYALGRDGKCYDSIGYFGPMVGFGLEWRP